MMKYSMDINEKSVPLYEAAEKLGCGADEIRDLVRTGQAEVFLLLNDSFVGERRKIRTDSKFSKRTVEEIVEGLEGPLLFKVSADDMDAAINGDGIGSLSGHWREDPDLLGGPGGVVGFIDYTFTAKQKIKLPLSSPLWRLRLSQVCAIRELCQVKKKEKQTMTKKDVSVELAVKDCMKKYLVIPHGKPTRRVDKEKCIHVSRMVLSLGGLQLLKTPIDKTLIKLSGSTIGMIGMVSAIAIAFERGLIESIKKIITLEGKLRIAKFRILEYERLQKHNINDDVSYYAELNSKQQRAMNVARDEARTFKKEANRLGLALEQMQRQYWPVRKYCTV